MLNTLSVKNRLMLLVCLLATFMIALSSIGLLQTSAIKGRLKTVYEDRTVALTQLMVVMDNLHRSRGRIISAMIAEDAAKASKETDGIPGFLAESDKQWAAYMATYLTPEEKTLAANFDKSYKEFHKAMDVVKPVAAQGDKDKTAEIMASTDFRKFFNASRDDLNKLTDLQARVAKEEYEGGIADYDAARIEMGLAVGIGLLLAISIATGIIRSIAGPLKTAVEAAQHVAAGNLTHPIRTDAKAEMGQLLTAMSQMQQSLTELVGHIQRDATHLSGTAASLADSAAEVARASGLQSDASSSIAASVEEMTVSINHISARTGDTREVSVESGKLSESGANISSQAADSMRLIAQTVNIASGQIEDLSHKIDRVSGIVNVIKDIADQTNLLALNAAIEAARAGEQGRGFAVVADEVRKLAERTSQSTQEIGNVIGEILTAAAVSVEGMKTSVDQVHQGVKLSEEAGETINRIHDMEVRVVEAVNEIADALQEQSAASTDIAQQIERIAQATEENNAAIAATAESSQTVNSLGKSLLQTVSRFRV